jgi:hypothetical protein
MSDTGKTAIYCRTARADAGAIAAQEARLRARAHEHGHADGIPYADNGAAGPTLDRPAMNALTTDIQSGKIGAVLAVNPSRIARTIPMMSEWRRLTCEHGVTLITLAEGEQNAAAETAETLELTYRLVGDYLLPNLALSDPPGAEPLGHYGRIRRTFLREHRPALYSKMLLSETLFPHLREIDEAARSRATEIQDREIAREVILAELVNA